MRRPLLLIMVILALATGLSPLALAGNGLVKVSYEDGKKQSFKLNSSPSNIKRMTLDKEKGGDRLVVTYHDNTHQVFVLKKALHKVTRVLLEGHDGQEAARDAAHEPSVDMKGYFNPGRVWRVTELCGGAVWSGTWTRRGTSLVYDAYWESSKGEQMRSEVEIVEVTSQRIKVFRRDKGAAYDGTLSADMTRVLNGWAPWYGQHCQSWSAVIE